MINQSLKPTQLQLDACRSPEIQFPIDWNSIQQRILAVHPIKYAKNRNFINGSVSYLSPYISRGVISLPDIAQSILQKFSKKDAEKFIQELSWREYFQRVFQEKSHQITSDLKHAQDKVESNLISKTIINHQTQIESIDKAIQGLYATGYMHNHLRMYVAMLACNIARTHWLNPARWMYAHLLDGDIASNHLSWQWVAGTFSNKKYVANQENINRYSFSNQTNTYLDKTYDEIIESAIPPALQIRSELKLKTTLPNSILNLNASLPFAVYTIFNLDPKWLINGNYNRILWLDPAHFNQYPITQKVLDWILLLAKSIIPDVQIFVGSIDDLYSMVGNQMIHFKEHPTLQIKRGIQHSRAWLFPDVVGYYPSFSAYWKQCQKYFYRW